MDYLKSKNGLMVEVDGELATVKTKVASEFKKIRLEKNLTQLQVAEVAGMNRVDVSRFESERYNPSLELIVRYASALGCDVRFELIPRNDV